MNSQDPNNEGLAVDGNTVTRAEVQPAVKGFPRYDFLDGRKGYIENPDRDQHTAGGCPPILDIRATTVAVAKTNPNLKCADEVYVRFRFQNRLFVYNIGGIRTVDDHGGKLKAKQIDVWIGQGDQTVKNKANDLTEAWTVLKIIRN